MTDESDFDSFGQTCDSVRWTFGIFLPPCCADVAAGVRDLPPIEQVLRGTLVETYKRCGRQNCHCVDGPGHGPKRYLSISQPGTGGRQRRDYVPNDIHEQVAHLIGNFRALRAGLDEICAINTELLRRREELG